MKQLSLFAIASVFVWISSTASAFDLIDDTGRKPASTNSYGLQGRWGVGLGVGMTSIEGPKIVKDVTDAAPAYSLWGRYHLTDRIGFEAALSRLQYKFTGANSDLDPITDMVDVSAAYRMWPTQAFHVLLQLGAGYARITDFGPAGTDLEKMDDYFIKGRVGFEYMAMNNLMVALHGDFYKINMGGGPDSEIRVLSPNLAVTWYFGSRKADVDSDGDGVYDSADKCPGTEANATVDADGCVAAPATLDADKDGVNDADDRCPGTPAGQAVNEFGCAKTEKLEITLNVRFKPGSSVIDPQFTGDLDTFAQFLTKYPDTKAEIEGHTDNTGAEKLNFSISQKRAQAVVNALVKNHKIDKKRLTAKGYGPSQPIADNGSEDGRAKNRRVVAHVITVK